MPDSHFKMLFSLTLGSFFEIFDFLCFAFLSSILATLFFPPHIQHLALLFTYLTLGVSYLLRPIGGLILGHLGDKLGRKSIFTLSIFCMSVPSFLIGCLPTFATLGYCATVLLILARLLQGFSLGGEVPGSITYMAEKFKGPHLFFYCALLTFGANLGVVFAAETVQLISHANPEWITLIGWRIPFWIGGGLTILAFYIRRSLQESSEFQQLQMSKQLSRAPLTTLLKHFKLPLLSGMGLALVVSLTTSVFHVFLPGLLVQYYGVSLSTSTHITVCGALVLAVFSLVFAYFCRHTTVIYFLRIALVVLLTCFGILLASRLPLQGATQGVYIVVIGISFILAAINGTFFGVLASFFPTQVRFSGISLCYNTAYILGAGLTPIWTSLLLTTTGNYLSIIGVCFMVVILALMNTIWIKRFEGRYL